MRISDWSSDVCSSDLAQGEADELVDLLEVWRRGHRAGEDQRERQLRVLLAQQDAEQVEDLLGGADAAGKHHDAVAEPDEGFQPLLDVRHDHQLVDDRRSEEHTSELQSLMRISYAVFCLKKKKNNTIQHDICKMYKHNIQYTQ